MVKSRESRYLNKTSGDILRAILSLVGPDGIASMSDIARRNNTSRAFVTKMLKSLSDEGMVDYVAYRGVGLTPDGLRVANELARHHRLLEVFLIDTLGFSSEAAHEEAE
ncbi:MAG: metal-dependent transcriptional regulator, partial [Armatimonadaceae bacterium]